MLEIKQLLCIQTEISLEIIGTKILYLCLNEDKRHNAIAIGAAFNRRGLGVCVKTTHRFLHLLKDMDSYKQNAILVT